MRSLANFSTGYPNMRGHISNHAATMAEVLRDEGYATFAVGKWHLCQMEDASAAGPYDQWPLQRGFDRFYGFLDGETDQFHPELVYDNHAVDQPRSAEEGYHLTEDLVDRAIGFMHDSKSIRPDRPFFLYLAPGATHAPHQAPAEYLAKYRGAFDDGWDAARDAWFSRQLQMGLLPAGTQLAPRNPGVEEWVTHAGEPPPPGRQAAGGLRRVPRSHRRPDRPAGRRARASRRARQHAAAAALRQRREPGGRPVRRPARVEVLQLRDRVAGRRGGQDRRHRRPGQPHQLPVGLGAGGQHAASSGTSRTRTRAACTCR